MNRQKNHPLCQTYKGPLWEKWMCEFKGGKIIEVGNTWILLLICSVTLCWKDRVSYLSSSKTFHIYFELYSALLCERWTVFRKVTFTANFRFVTPLKIADLACDLMHYIETRNVVFHFSLNGCCCAFIIFSIWNTIMQFVSCKKQKSGACIWCYPKLDRHSKDCCFYSLSSSEGILKPAYTFCVDWVCSKEEGSKQRSLGSVVQNPIALIIGQSTNQYSKHINHKGGYDSMKDNVQHMEADRVQASCQEVVQPADTRGE